ncbi:hypothetical protein V1525DRAFT_421279 [Lipomyces kononenkoae]|uniref:Uncharacterized protein n=1 Tax=Lipomyces kononenkoae TaxID=34357 RepID=A0ACC3SVV8_LIPKO
MAEQTVPDSEMPSPRASPVDAAAWLQHLLQAQPDAANAQTQQMLLLIQQQGQRIDQVANLLAVTEKPARPKLPNPEKFTADDLSLLPQFLRKLRAKLEIDADASGAGKAQVWFCFSRLDGKAAARRYFAQLSVAFEDPVRKDKALNRLNTLSEPSHWRTNVRTRPPLAPY